MLRMPLPDDSVLQRRGEIVAALRRIVPGEGVIDSEVERRVYESDGLTAYGTLPMVVVLPDDTAQVVAVLRYCNAHGIKVVPRGAGTSLSGGALPLALGSGEGASLRQPLGIAIVGGLVVSQALTLYTTPVVYLALDRMRHRFNARWRLGEAAAPRRQAPSRPSPQTP